LALPFKEFFYIHTRVGFYNTLMQIFTPVGLIRFTDFFLADILTSMVKPLTDLSYAVCFFVSGEFLQAVDATCKDSYNSTNGVFLNFTGNITCTEVISTSNTCSTYKTLYFSFVFSVLPFVCRFVQCVRKYLRSKDRKLYPHLVNAGKYSTAIINGTYLSIITILYNGTLKWDGAKITYIIIQFITTTYAFIWDILVDWKLFQPSSHTFLRNLIVLPRFRPFYYIAMILDLLLRYFWAYTLTNAWGTVNSNLAYLALSFLEIFRRAMWAFFRVENEAVTNHEDYRNFNFPVPKLGLLDITKNLNNYLNQYSLTGTKFHKSKGHAKLLT